MYVSAQDRHRHRIAVFVCGIDPTKQEELVAHFKRHGDDPFSRPSRVKRDPIGERGLLT